MFFDKENLHNTGIGPVPGADLNKSSQSIQKSFNTTQTKSTIPTVLCEKFQGAVWIGFGCVSVNHSTTREFKLANQSSKPVTISVDKCPTKKGFMIHFGEQCGKSVIVGANESVLGSVQWTPSEDISVREAAVLLMDGKHRLPLTLHGISGVGTPKVIVGKNKIVKNVSKPAVHKVPKKQNVLKPLMTAKPTGKSHYAEKKIEKKVTKQREECLSRVNTDRDKCVNKQEQSLMEWVNGKLLSQGIETGDDNAYDEFDRCRTEEKHRSEFAEILNDEDTVSVLRRVKSEVFSNRLSLRADRNVKAHVGFKDGITNMLLSYDPIFLRLGLETVFDMKITVPDAFNLSTTISKKSTEKKHTSSIWTHQLKKVIQDKVLHSTEIDATYLKEGVIVTPAIEKKIQESLRQHILSCVLAIIFVLDEARMNNMCSCHLTLFRTDAEIKSSKDMIVELSRSFLQHEGDVVKHLSGLGYTVEFVQTTFHDFDFQCTNILADLRDGVRLARLVDLLCDSNESHSLVSSLLRVPAVSRLQKMHNVGISLKYLRMNGLDLHNIDEKSIVDGHQNSTILLLWTLLFEFDLKFVVGLSDIKTEIENIGNEKGEEFSSIEEVKEPKAFFGQLKSLLLTWCDSIAFKHQNLNIQNMSESLIDGQMLCLLVHHYHSNVLPLELVKDSSDSSNIGGEKKTIIYSLESLSKNNRNVVRRSNLLTLSRALKVLGGVPFMLSTEGSTDERTMVMFLGFLFARLMHTSKQSTEASLIQKTIRPSKKAVVPHIQSHSDITVTVYESKKQTAMVLIEKFVSENWSRRRNALRHLLLKDENSVQKTVEEVFIEKEESNHAFEKKESNHALVKEESNRASEKKESNHHASEKDESNRASENEESNHASEKDESNHASLEVVVQDEISDVVDIDDILFADVEQPMEDAVECKDSAAEIERVDITNMHKICMTEMVLKVKSGAALKNETLGRLAAEQKLEELRNFYESSMSSALSAQRSLEAKLAFEVKEKERIRLEMEISNLEDMINVAEAKLMKECKEYHATLTIQKFGNLALREIRWRASVAEQAHHVIVRCKAAVTLQSFSRGLVFRRQFRKLRASACVIQQKVRSRQAMLLHHRQSDIARHLISTWIEGVILKARFCKIRKAVVSIQRFYTSRIVRKGFLHSKMQICKIQQAWKLHLRNVALKRHRSAVLIQSVVIKKVYVKNAKQRVSAMKLQSFWARCKLKIALFKEKESSVNKHLSASIVAKAVLVRFFRRAVTRKLTKRAALTIERWLVWCLPGVRARKLVNGFIRLQAFRRSIMTRRRQSVQIKEMYAKIKIANMHALKNPEMKLSTRTQTALLTLQKGKMISHVLKACQTLEFSTSFSMICCSNFVKASASKVLFTLIRSCNRSTPHQELLRCALTVLINVTKDVTLAENVVHNGDTTEMLVDLMQMFRDKKLIFNLSCELLTRFVFAQSDIKAECLAPDMKKRLDGILHILERKHRLDQRVRSISSRTKSDAGKGSPKSADSVSTAAPFELMQTFMTHLNII